MCICIDLEKSFTKAENLNIYKEGELTVIAKTDKKYACLMDGWTQLIDGAHDMPAFGVSLNNLTLKEMQHGLWVEFVFENTFESNGLPYQKLLIKVEKENCGFNLIRYTAECGYDGRCFYFDLINKNVTNFYEILSNI